MRPRACPRPRGCAFLTAEVDGITFTDPYSNDTDGDGLNDSREALILLTDPTAVDTDNDGISDGVEVNGSYGNPPSDLTQGTTTPMEIHSTMVSRTQTSTGTWTQGRRIRPE